MFRAAAEMEAAAVVDEVTVKNILSQINTDLMFLKILMYKERRKKEERKESQKWKSEPWPP